jgi:hypothetical protein
MSSEIRFPAMAIGKDLFFPMKHSVRFQGSDNFGLPDGETAKRAKKKAGSEQQSKNKSVEKAATPATPGTETNLSLSLIKFRNQHLSINLKLYNK